MIVSPRAMVLAENTLPAVRHLPDGIDDRIRRVIARAVLDLVAVVEEPVGSNRGVAIDEYNAKAHVPAGSFWCASAVGAWWEDAGLVTPKGRASCDNWMTWAKATNRWSTTPALGAAVLYGVPGDARHIGLIVRIAPLVMSVEGNTTVEGSKLERNGTAVALKLVTKEDPVLGYCLPLSRTIPGESIAA